MASFLSAVVRAQPGTHFELVDQATGRVLVPNLEAAIDSASRKKGLLGRDGLPAGTGLVIAPTNAVHTFFMKFPIDIAFVTKAGRVVKLREAVPARRLAAALRAFAVVELAAGEARRAGLIPGTSVIARATNHATAEV